MAETYKVVTSPDEYRQSKYDGIRVNPTLAPVVIAIGLKRQKSEKISELDEIQAVACAVQNMHLTAAAHGLGGFWSTNPAAISDRMRQFLDLAARDRSLGLFYLGYPAGDWPNSVRRPVDEKVTRYDV